MKRIITKGKKNEVVRTPEAFLLLLGIDPVVYRKCLRTIPLLYKNILIPKKSGGRRPISVPKDELKLIQRAILDKIFSKIHLPFCVYGFSKGKTIIENAKYHANSDYLLNLDIQNFFPSVHFEKIKQMYRDIGFNELLSDILCKLTTHRHCLPQGAPTSPFLASFALNNLDVRLMSLAKNNHISYTRYFDDLCFSGSKRILILEKDIFNIISQEGYKVNRGKREFYDKGKIKEINGISISNRKLFLKDTDNLLLYLRELKDFGISKSKSDNLEKEHASLVGKVGFLKAVDQINGKLAEQTLGSIKW